MGRTRRPLPLTWIADEDLETLAAHLERTVGGLAERSADRDVRAQLHAVLLLASAGASGESRSRRLILRRCPTPTARVALSPTSVCSESRARGERPFRSPSACSSSFPPSTICVCVSRSRRLFSSAWLAARFAVFHAAPWPTAWCSARCSPPAMASRPWDSRQPRPPWPPSSRD